MTRILIAEDEPGIAAFLDKGLRRHGFATLLTDHGPTALAIAQSAAVDLVLLDIGLRGMDGLTVLDRLRRSGSRLPVVILSARDEVSDTVAGLEGGADDYMTKPFGFDELLARVRLRLRDAGSVQPDELTCGDLSLNLRTRRASVQDRVVDLTAREFALAEVFLRHPDQVLSREQLLSRVWGLDFDPGSNVVEVYVRYLRIKLGDERIETVRGAGYRLVC